MNAVTASHTGRLSAFALPLAVVGLLITVAGVVLDTRIGWSGALIGAAWGIQLALGAAFTIALAVVVGAKWYRPIARDMTHVARLLVVPGVIIIAVIAASVGTLYTWADPQVMATNHLVHMKSGWLNVPFFIARTALYVAIWLGFIHLLSKRIDVITDMRSAAWPKLGGLAALFLIVFALTISGAWWDWMMSLEPIWFSTMQGVYGFAGTFVAGIATVTLVVIPKVMRGELKLKTSQVHDLGKLLFAFQFFWAYIWFCQFMLIWYANIPEEASWYVHRLEGGWQYLFVLNPFINFVLPFTILMSARVKKRPNVLIYMALLALFGRWFDLWLQVGPTLQPHPYLPIWAMGGAIFVLGAMLWRYHRTLPAS